jgi:hypothetical protein
MKHTSIIQQCFNVKTNCIASNWVDFRGGKEFYKIGKFYFERNAPALCKELP